MTAIGQDVTVEHAIAAIQAVMIEVGLEASGVTAESRLDTLGLSSLDISEVIINLEDLCGCELDLPTTTDGFAVVADLTRLRPVHPLVTEGGEPWSSV
jgi:acyl carrier protein